MPEIRLYLVHNMDEHRQPVGMLSIETNIGSIVPVFTTVEAVQSYLQDSALWRALGERLGPRAIIEHTAPSFQDWLFQLRMIDRSTANVIFLLDTDPDWLAVYEQLRGGQLQ